MQPAVRREITRVAKEINSRPANPHPSDWAFVPKPKDWAMDRFRLLPKKLLLDAEAEARSPFIQPDLEGTTPLEQAYLSKTNLNCVHRALLAELAVTHGYRISPQDETALLNVMTQVLRDRVDELESHDDILGSIQVLDAFALETACQIVLNEIKHFVRDRNAFEVNPINPLPLPEWTDPRNKHPLPMQQFYVRNEVTKRPASSESVGDWPR
jgi:hypothetical protein